MDSAKSLPLAVRFDDEARSLVLLDQRVLPLQETYIYCRTIESVHDAIQTMVVRGAPAIGVAAAYGVALAALEAEGACLPETIRRKAVRLAGARPTAVNLGWAVSRMLRRMDACASLPPTEIYAALLEEAKRIHGEDIDACRHIGEALLPYLRDGMGILTHCNAGQLATSRYGTALSPIYLGHEKGMRFHVYADETRPRLQGSTLTAFELSAAGVDVTVLCDNMAAAVMAQGKIDCCIVGCDRVASNGDIANKIGTLGVAVLARHFGIPFYVAAPFSTIDPACPDGAHIPIEERDGAEVSERFGIRTVPPGVRVYNPSFDVTPHTLITAYATEKGLFRPPFAFT